MPNLIVIAKVTAVEGKTEEAKLNLQGLIEPTLKEEGCIQYDLHQDNTSPHLFYFYEIWESEEHLKAHSLSPHILAMRENSKECIISSELSLMSKL